jgi:hypothetical protein
LENNSERYDIWCNSTFSIVCCIFIHFLNGSLFLLCFQ